MAKSANPGDTQAEESARGSKPKEIKVYGHNACAAVFAHRPQSIVRALVSEKAAPKHGELMKYLAAERKSYKVCSPEELERFAGARHHEGVCLLVREREQPPWQEVAREPGPALILALDGVGNPHNLGTLLRTAAHFGARAVWVAGQGKALSSAAYRTAEGAAENVFVYFAAELDDFLAECDALDLRVCATSSHQGRSIFQSSLPTRAVMILGSERDGLSESRMKSADELLSIPGTSLVESLNVAASASVLLAEHWRQHGG